MQPNTLQEQHLRQVHPLTPILDRDGPTGRRASHLHDHTTTAHCTKINTHKYNTPRETVPRRRKGIAVGQGVSCTPRKPRKTEGMQTKVWSIFAQRWAEEEYICVCQEGQ
jgi:hypothetical protein